MQKRHCVQQGDSIASLAFGYGFKPETIWNHPDNARLKAERENRNIIYPGDSVFIPEKQPKAESAPTEQRHRFRRKGVPERLRIRIMTEEPREQASSDQPRSDASGTASTPSDTSEPGHASRAANYQPCPDIPFRMEIDGNLISGTTDADGFVECSIPPNARSGRIILNPGEPDEWTIPVQLGHLNPLSKISGVKQRLRNLGFDCGGTDEAETPELRETLRRFQQQNGIQVTGQLDDETKSKLKDVHGS